MTWLGTSPALPAQTQELQRPWHRTPEVGKASEVGKNPQSQPQPVPACPAQHTPISRSPLPLDTSRGGGSPPAHSAGFSNAQNPPVPVALGSASQQTGTDSSERSRGFSFPFSAGPGMEFLPQCHRIPWIPISSAFPQP